jgi:hypothetical protein
VFLTQNEPEGDCILGPGGSAVATVRASPISIPAWSRREFEQQVVVNGPSGGMR